MRVLLLGGSKSGKSGLAQELSSMLASGGRKIYWATMEPVDGEDEARIEKHIEDRLGMGFETIECGKSLLARADEAEGATVLFDSVTAYLANEMFGGGFDENAPERAAGELLELSLSCDNFVCVCDELFRGGEDHEGLTEDYVRGLAMICRTLAAHFDTVCEVVCGVPHTVKGSLDPLGITAGTA